MSNHLAGVLAQLLEGLMRIDLASIDQIADMLSDHGIYVDELGEEEHGMVDQFLQDALAIWATRDQS